MAASETRFEYYAQFFKWESTKVPTNVASHQPNCRLVDNENHFSIIAYQSSWTIPSMIWPCDVCYYEYEGDASDGHQ
jgi:hypothetical protein